MTLKPEWVAIFLMVVIIMTMIVGGAKLNKTFKDASKSFKEATSSMKMFLNEFIHISDKQEVNKKEIIRVHKLADLNQKDIEHHHKRISKLEGKKVLNGEK